MLSENIQSRKEADLHITHLSICGKWYDIVCAKYRRMWQVILGVECVCEHMLVCTCVCGVYALAMTIYL